MRNVVKLIGNLGQDINLRKTPQGKSVASCSIAVTERFKNNKGESKENTQWFALEFWGTNADNAAKVAMKGADIIIDGRLKNEQYVSKSGDVRFATKVVVEAFIITRIPKNVVLK